jgi:hypothetical protein
MDLPENVARAVAPLFETLPPDEALSCLVVTDAAPTALTGVVETVLRDEALRDRPALQSALWLYVDELDRSHTISQGIDDATGSFWHGIMHRREGDFSNSHYWFRKVGEHPAMALVDGYDAHQMIDDVESLHTDSPAHLIDLQRREWQTLFAWCVAHHDA